MHSQHRCDNTCTVERHGPTVGHIEETGLAACGTVIWQAVRGCRTKQHCRSQRWPRRVSVWTPFRRMLHAAGLWERCKNARDGSCRNTVHRCCGLHQSRQTTEQLATKLESILSSWLSARCPRPKSLTTYGLHKPVSTKTNRHLCNTPPSSHPFFFCDCTTLFCSRRPQAMLKRSSFPKEGFFLFHLLFFFFGSGFLTLHNCRTWSEAGGRKSL